MSEQPSAAELGRRLDDLRADVRHVSERLDRLPDQTDLQTVATAWHASLEAQDQLHRTWRDHLETRVSSVESWQTWALRLVVGAVATAILSAMIVLGRL